MSLIRLINKAKKLLATKPAFRSQRRSLRSFSTSGRRSRKISRGGRR